MKKLMLVLASVIAVTAAPARADQAGQLGIGLMFGSPMGATAKWWYNDVLAFDGGSGYGNAGVFFADMHLNSWTLIRQPRDGKANLYVGAGPRIATDDGGQFAIRAMAGVGYWPSGRPVELFAEIGPTLKITPDHETGLDGAVGFRYYFKVSAAPAGR